LEWKNTRKSPTFVEDQWKALEEFDWKTGCHMAHSKDITGILPKTNPAPSHLTLPPATSILATSNPATPNPATSNLAILDPATSNPAKSNPTSNPATSDPATLNLATSTQAPTHLATNAPNKPRSVVRVQRHQEKADAMDVDDSDDGSDYRPSVPAPSSELPQKDKGKQKATTARAYSWKL
jgi:hypothetical protein